MEYLAESYETEHRQAECIAIPSSVLDAVELAMHRTQSMVVSLCSLLGETDTQFYMKPIRKQWKAWNVLREQASRVKRRAAHVTDIRIATIQSSRDLMEHKLVRIADHFPKLKSGKRRCVECSKLTRWCCIVCSETPALCDVRACNLDYHNPGHPNKDEFHHFAKTSKPGTRGPKQTQTSNANNTSNQIELE
jgi:hypothetical protein